MRRRSSLELPDSKDITQLSQKLEAIFIKPESEAKKKKKNRHGNRKKKKGEKPADSNVTENQTDGEAVNDE